MPLKRHPFPPRRKNSIITLFKGEMPLPRDISRAAVRKGGFKRVPLHLEDTALLRSVRKDRKPRYKGFFLTSKDNFENHEAAHLVYAAVRDRWGMKGLHKQSHDRFFEDNLLRAMGFDGGGEFAPHNEPFPPKTDIMGYFEERFPRLLVYRLGSQRKVMAALRQAAKDKLMQTHIATLQNDRKTNTESARKAALAIMHFLINYAKKRATYK